MNRTRRGYRGKRRGLEPAEKIALIALLALLAILILAVDCGGIPPERQLRAALTTSDIAFDREIQTACGTGAQER